MYGFRIWILITPSASNILTGIRIPAEWNFGTDLSSIILAYIYETFCTKKRFKCAGILNSYFHMP